MLEKENLEIREAEVIDEKIEKEKPETRVSARARVESLDKEESVMISLTIPPNLLEKVNEASQNFNVSRASLVREAIQKYVDFRLDLKDIKDVFKNAREYGFNVDRIIEAMRTKRIEYLTPKAFKYIRSELEGKTTALGLDKWQEFREKTNLTEDLLEECLEKNRAVRIAYD